MAEQHFSPNLFLFQQYVAEVLKESKKIIKTGLFENLDPQTLVKSNNNQQIDIYHQYFLSAMSHPKCRELACNRLQKLIKQNLVDRENLPVGMISSILSACSSGGGSTTGSSSVGSATISINPQNQAAFVGDLVKSIILNTAQPPGQLTVGLNFILEGTRKKLSHSYLSMLEDIYTLFLVKNRQPPLTRFISRYISNLIEEIQANFDNPDYVYCSRKLNPKTNKVQMPIYDEDKGWGKYGKCYMCSKEAYHYIKEEYMPICSIQCKNRAKELMEECQSNQSFNLIGWLLDNIQFGDQIIYSILSREIAHYIGLNKISFSTIQTILKVSIHHIGNAALHKYVLQIHGMLSLRFEGIVSLEDLNSENRQKLELINKVYYLQTIKILEESPIQKENLEYVQAIINILKDNTAIRQIFIRYDSNFFEINILSKFMNVISQYAKIFSVCIEGLAKIMEILMDKYVTKGFEEKGKNWSYSAFNKKREIKKVIKAFNKKPINGIKLLKKLFEDKEFKEQKEEIKLQDSQISISDENSKSQIDLQSSSISQKKEQKSDTQSPTKEQKQDIKSQSVSIEIVQVTQNLPPISQKLPSKTSKKEELSIKTKLTSRQIAIFIKQNLQTAPSFSLQPKLIQLPSLDKAKVGQFFGTDNPECQQICKQFMRLLDVEGLQIDDALRMILNLFTLPKETQQIQRIIGNISARLLGKYSYLLNQDSVYQYIYVLMMVQTNQNPNVQQKDRLKLDDYLNMCRYVEGGVEKDFAVRNFNRILQYPLELKLKFSDEQIFIRKYLMKLEKEGEQNQLFEQNGHLNKNTYQKSFLLYIWEYLLIGLISLTNTQGLFPAIVLYGKYDLVQEQKAFFEAYRKIAQTDRSMEEECNFQLLQIAIQYGNYLHTVNLWESIISILYHLESMSQLHSSTLDKLFTNSKLLNAQRLKEFVQALLVFSTSQFKKDGGYMRQLFVLRHVTQVIEYNVSRWSQIQGQVWGMLGDYFKDICVHPRRQIAMSAIDSYKQLSLKLFKFPFNPPIQHSPILATYLYIFMRSPLQLKDLIINILLTLISRDLNSGWENIYGILEIADSQDREVIGRIVGRMITEVGVARLDEIGRLHAICLRQIKLRGQNGRGGQEMLRYVWQISEFIDTRITWLETMRSIRDVYKMTYNYELLNLFYRIANKCLLWHPSQRSRRDSIDLIQQSKAIRFKNEQTQQQIKENETISINQQIYGQTVDLLIFMMDLGVGGNVKKQGKVFQIVGYALAAFQQIQPWFFIKYLGDSAGFLSIFQLFLSSAHKLQFVLWLRAYLIERILPLLLQGDQFEKEKQQMYNWIISAFAASLPMELANMREMDSDFKKELKDILREAHEEPQSDQKKDQNKNELIQFHLSSKDYYEKCITHLIFLDVIEDIYVKGLKPFIPLNSKLIIKVEQTIIDSYEQSLKINKLVLLRSFLHANNFISTPVNQNSVLPGLHKQQHRTISVIINQMDVEDKWEYFVGLIKKYVEKMKLRAEISKEIQKDEAKKKSNAQKSHSNKQKQSKDTHKTGKNKTGAVAVAEPTVLTDRRWQIYHSDISHWLLQNKQTVIHSLRTLISQLQDSKSFLHRQDALPKQKQLFDIGLSCLSLPDIDRQIVQITAALMQKVYKNVV